MEDHILISMKLYLAVLFVIVLSGVVQAMSVEEIGRLAELKTSDTLILQLIEQKGLDQPLATKDVIYLREHGASEKVIQYLLALSEPEKASPQAHAEEGSQRVSDNIRTYTTTNKDGKKVRVVTNMDENGKRMGGPIPAPAAEPEPEQISYAEPPAPQEIYVTVRDERGSNQDYESDYPEEPSGIPLYDMGYPYYSPGYFPYPIPGMHHHQNSPHWRFNAAVRPLRPQHPRLPAPVMRAHPASLPSRPSR
jgi:hypothetical protein